jgi:prophage tail gpP-like protein
MASDELSLTINGSKWEFWDDIEIHLGLDSHATVGFAAPWHPWRSDYRDKFRPFSFAPVEVDVGSERLFTGTMVEVIPDVSAASQSVTVSAYSRPAILEDVDPPINTLPFEANGLSLRQIAEQFCRPFGIPVVFNAPDTAPFKRINTRSRKVDGRADADQKVQEFLAELARQRALIISSTKKGELLFTQSVRPGNPVARFVEGDPPLVSARVSFNPQSYYDEITGFTSAKRGRVGAKYTERLRRLSGGVMRTLNFRLDDSEKGHAPAAVRAKLGRMLGNVVSYVVNIPTWRDPSGKLWEPNTTVTLQSDGAMVYAETELLVRDVYLKQSHGEQTASLGLVLPGAFSGEVPTRMPWDDP